MPRHDVRMMLHDAEHDLVAGLKAGREIGLRREIDRFGSPPRVDDFVGMGRVQKPLYARAPLLVSLRRGARKIMHAAMHIGVFRGRERSHRIQHLHRLLRRRGVVEIDELLAVDLDGENWKITPQFCNVVGRHVLAQLCAHGSSPSRRESLISSLRQRASCTASPPKPSTASSRNPRMRRPRASVSGMPRERR